MSFDAIALPSTLKKWESISELASSVEQIIICESSCPFPTLNTKDINLQVHVYQPSDSESFEEFAAASGSQDDDDSMAATVCELPNRLWNGLWDSLIYNDDIKMKLLDYIHATLIFSDANVDCELDAHHMLWYVHFLQSILCLGTGSCFCMDPPAQEKHLFVERWHRSSQYDYPTGTREHLFLGSTHAWL